MKIKQQIRRLLTLEFLGNFKLGGSAWVLLMVGRGFSLLDVGLAEGFFHVVSLCCEIPSGMLADVLGRRRTLAASYTAFALSAVAMIVSQTMVGLCLAMALSAMAYNLASGTREAITYDSLLSGGGEEHYLRVSSWQNVLWRLSSGAALLCVGVAVRVGYRWAYGLDVLLALICLILVLGLWEPKVTQAQAERGRIQFRDLPRLLKACAKESVRFLKERPRLVLLMLFNALVGAVATLLRFFLQDGLSTAGASPLLLGPMLLCIELGGVAGARLSLALDRLPYRGAAVLCAGGQACALALFFTGNPWLMALGGFVAVVCDDGLQVLTDARLNAAVPSDQRATLISVSSMCFSLVMIILSPLAGALL